MLTQKKESWLKILETVSLDNTKDLNLIHNNISKTFYDYLAIGGMPEAIREFNDTKSYNNVQRIQNHILLTYENDFSKYALSKAEENYIQLIYEKTPAFVAENFKYSKISNDVQSRSLKPALTKLVKAQVIHKVYSTSASRLPLKSLHLFMQEKNSKIGIKISQASLSFEKNILSVPFYLIKQINRLLSQAME